MKTQTKLYIRRKTPLIMTNSDGVLRLKALHQVETKEGSRGWWNGLVVFEDSATREQWIGEELEAGAKLFGTYPLSPILKEAAHE